MTHEPAPPAIRSELTLSHIGVWASGEWECTVSTAQGNASKKVEIVVLETSASYCPAERVANNRGDFRFGLLRPVEGCPAPNPTLAPDITGGQSFPIRCLHWVLKMEKRHPFVIQPEALLSNR